MKTYIYILIDPITNQIRYVGKANNPLERYKNHKNDCRDKNTHKRNWIKSLKTLGKKPEIEIIEEVGVGNWKVSERFWISYFKMIGCNLTNYLSGGDGLTFGNSTSFKKGNKPWNSDTLISRTCLECFKEYKPYINSSKQEYCSVKCAAKNRISNTQFKKGVVPWNKGVKGYSTSKKGKTISDSIKNKISNTLLGKPSKKKRIINQYNKDMNFIKQYPSITEAIKETKIKSINNALTGRAKTAGGYIWQ